MHPGPSESTPYKLSITVNFNTDVFVSILENVHSTTTTTTTVDVSQYILCPWCSNGETYFPTEDDFHTHIKHAHPEKESLVITKEHTESTTENSNLTGAENIETLTKGNYKLVDVLKE